MAACRGGDRETNGVCTWLHTLLSTQHIYHTDVCIVLPSGSQISVYIFQITFFFFLSQRVYPGYTFGYLHQLGKQIDK